MSHLKAVSFDEDSQIRDEFHYDSIEDKVISKRFQDVEPILDFNKEARNSINTGKMSEVHHVARIPLIVIEKWKNEGVIDWFKSTDAERRRVLNDPANAMFRTRKCKL